MNKKIMAFLLFSVIFFLGFVPPDASASEKPNYPKIYAEGVKEGIIDPGKVPYEKWVKEDTYYENYLGGLKEKVYDARMTYEKWIQLNHYGRPPEEGEGLEEVPKTWQITPRGAYKGYHVLKGDILITNGTSSKGIVGHAAIANGDEYILDIPGFGKTTRQQTTKKWVNYYDDRGWVKVYRLKNRSIAHDAARWADLNYYSSKGTRHQDRFPSYGFPFSKSTTSTTYCSRIVIQAYYFGTGKHPVISRFNYLIFPYHITGYFNSSYKPQYVRYFR